MATTTFDFTDLTPIPQDEGPTTPIVPIAYAPEYRQNMDLMRALMAKDEMSERAFALTETIVESNPAHYTIWQYRQRLLLELKKDLELELEFVTEMIEDNPKSYQLWHHRQFLLTNLSAGKSNADVELEFTRAMIAQDSKNYHAWSYRQWVISYFTQRGSLEAHDEIAFTEELLNEDVRNNSAWNQRFWVLERLYKKVKDNGDVSEFGKTVLENEVEFAFNRIKLTPSNESPFSYLKALFEYFIQPNYEQVVYQSIMRQVAALLKTHVSREMEKWENAADKESIRISTFVLSTFGYLVEQSVTRNVNYLQVSDEDNDWGVDKKKALLSECIKYYGILGSDFDTIRTKWWTFRKETCAKLATGLRA